MTITRSGITGFDPSNPGPIGAATPSTAKFTTVDLSSSLNFSGSQGDIKTAGTTRFTLDTTGNAGLGKSTGLATEANSPTMFIGGTLVAASSSSLGSTFGSFTINGIYDGVNAKYIDNNVAAQMIFNAGTIQFRRAISGTAGNNISWLTSARFNATGELGVGLTPNTDCNLQTNAGISVGNSANAVATVLDYYGEGTFTPAAAGTSTAGAGTYSVQLGKYTRIGDTVFFQIEIVQSAHSGTGNIKFTGLPFTSQSTCRAAPKLYSSGLALTAGNAVEAYIAASSTEITIDQETALGVVSGVPIPTGAATYIISGHYKV